MSTFQAENIQAPGGQPKKVENLVDDLNVATVTSSTGTQTLPEALDSRLSSLVYAANVREFGAEGDGVTDDSSAFEEAAKNAPADVPQPRLGDTIEKPVVARVVIPAGTYNLSRFLDVGNREIIWEADPAAVIPNYELLNGRLLRVGQRISDAQHTGALDSACSFAVLANQPLEEPAGITGIINDYDLSAYTDRDTVAAFASNRAPPLLAQINSATYTAQSVVLGSPLDENQVKSLRIGMIVDTQHSTKYSGFISGWSEDGSEIFVTGWYLGDGTPGGNPPATPPNGPGVYVNPFTKVWAHNANVFLEEDSHAGHAAGFELGVFNNKSPYAPATQEPRTWGYDCVNLGRHTAETAFIQRGTFFNGFESRAATGYGFIAKNIDQIYPSEATFCSKTSSGTQFLIQSAANQEKTSFSIDRNGNIEAGRTNTSGPVVYDFHSSGDDARDYDVRLQAEGGGGTDGSGFFRISSRTVSFTCGFDMNNQNFSPLSDNQRNLGAAGSRWNTLFATNGSINTSDRNRKQDIRDIEEAESRVARSLKSLIKAYRFKDAVEEKGDNARIHFGAIAQEVGDAFESEGLDPERYALYCKDETESGTLYGIRYSEMLAFIISAM